MAAKAWSGGGDLLRRVCRSLTPTH
jgi:hypothetical protein